jgi:hypothetical protein
MATRKEEFTYQTPRTKFTYKLMLIVPDSLK